MESTSSGWVPGIWISVGTDNAKNAAVADPESPRIKSGGSARMDKEVYSTE